MGILRRLAWVLLASVAVPACAPRTPVQKAGADQEIVRDICWELRDPRFARVHVSCVDGVLTVGGLVDRPEDAEAVREVVRSRGRGAAVVERLEVRPR